jgi:hypothetical protein
MTSFSKKAAWQLNNEEEDPPIPMVRVLFYVEYNYVKR